MKLFLATIATSLISTVAIADNSDRYNDLRLDTSKSKITQANDAREKQGIAFSTRNVYAKTPYAYLNPYGVGPNNDSR